MARIKNIDLPGDKHTCIGLTAIYGIGRPLAKTICKDAGVEETKKIKDLTEQEIVALRKEVDKYTVVIWLEGNDPECINDIIGGELKMQMNLGENTKSYER